MGVRNTPYHVNFNGGFSGHNNPGAVVWYVGAQVAIDGVAPSDGNEGRSPQKAFATIQKGLDSAVAGRGDVVALLPGTYTITAALTMSKADVTLKAANEDRSGINRASIVVNGAVDGIDVTGANCTIQGLHFPASTAAATARINCGAAGVAILDNTFECGANDLETITIPAAGLHTLIQGNRFYITANGPDAAIEIEDAAAHFINIVGNLFHGQNDTNAWDVGAVNSGVAHLDCYLADNRSTFGPAYIFSAAATGTIANNLMGEGTLGSMLDPGSCMCFENYEADAIDQSGRLVPTTVAS